jgi:hypothetical protein
MSTSVFKVLGNTFLKQHPQSAKDLPATSKLQLYPGMYLTVDNYSIAGKHYKIVLQPQKVVVLGEQNTGKVLQIPGGEWYIYGSPLASDPHVQVFTSSTKAIVTTASTASVEPSVVFTMSLPSTSQRALVVGTLDITGTTKPHSFTCTSGQPGYQYKGCTHTKGKAPLPSCKELSIENYWISTRQLERFQTKGIEGYAFHITPDPVKIRGVMRGEFMVHNDTNRTIFPGSSGCIVFLYDLGWKIWRDCMKEFRDRNITKVPLQVVC